MRRKASHTGALALVIGALGVGGALGATPSIARAQASAATPRFIRQPVDDWRDTAHHRSGFVIVAPGVKLHYLDWGGQGPSLVLLAGLGNTAHAFDDFAPAFTDRFHVVAVTRRGFGESSHPDSGYDTGTLVDDIHSLVDSLHLGRVILVGHSIAGEEMTRFAVTYPDRVIKLVYLDAAYDRVAADSLIQEVFPAAPDVPAPPLPEASDTASAAAYVAFVHRTRGVDIPEADIRARFRYDGWNEEITPAYLAIRGEVPRYSEIRAPALAIYAVTDDVQQLEPWQRVDRAHRAALAEMVRGDEVVDRALRAEFHARVPDNQVLEIHGAHHWIFVSNRDEVIAAVRRFLLQ